MLFQVFLVRARSTRAELSQPLEPLDETLPSALSQHWASPTLSPHRKHPFATTVELHIACMRYADSITSCPALLFSPHSFL